MEKNIKKGLINLYNNAWVIYSIMLIIIGCIAYSFPKEEIVTYQLYKKGLFPKEVKTEKFIVHKIHEPYNFYADIEQISTNKHFERVYISRCDNLNCLNANDTILVNIKLFKDGTYTVNGYGNTENNCKCEK